jgi:hypothetical protein
MFGENLCRLANHGNRGGLKEYPFVSDDSQCLTPAMVRGTRGFMAPAKKGHLSFSVGRLCFLNDIDDAISCSRVENTCDFTSLTFRYAE